jgi:hypothetical protein
LLQCHSLLHCQDAPCLTDFIKKHLRGVNSMKLYKRPEARNTYEFEMFSRNQYQLVVENEGCSGAQDFAEFFQVAGDHFIVCDLLQDLQTQDNKVYIVTCLNIEGTYTVTSDNSAASLGGGLDCTSESILLPFSVSPELPSDCIVDTLTQFGCSTDICSLS